MKDRINVPLLPSNIPKLIHRIKQTIGSIIMDFLNDLWREFDFRLDVYNKTQGFLETML